MAEARVEAQPATRTWFEILRTCTCSKQSGVDTISRWLLITRACVQPMTLTSGAIAGLLAARSESFDGLYYALAFVGIVLAHAANNMINDLFDARSGLDSENYPRSLYAPHPIRDGLVTERGLIRAILMVNALDAAIMVALFVARGWVVIAIALAGLFISVFYVAPPLRLKARGLGEPSVFVIWAPLMVGGTYYSATGHLPAEVLYAAVPYGLLVTTVLMGKHIDKVEWDEKNSVKTLPVLLGERSARRSTVFLMIGFYVAVAAETIAGVLPVWSVAVALNAAILRREMATFSRPKPNKPPATYPLWPLWFGPWAFMHARNAGFLFVAGLALGAVWPVTISF